MREFRKGGRERDGQPAGTGSRERDGQSAGSESRERDGQSAGTGSRERDGQSAGTGSWERDGQSAGTGGRERDGQLAGTGKLEEDRKPVESGSRERSRKSARKRPGGLKNCPAKDGEWTLLLREAFEAPPPLGKQRFFRNMPRRRISACRFVLRQAAYIRKWVWALSFAVFLTALAGGRALPEEVLWMLGALMPLLAVSVIAEYGRSEAYGMAELEMSARFGLKAVVLARMGILGALHFGTLCLVSILGRGDGGSVFRTGIWLLAPYLATDAAGLWVIRRLRGREGLYACLGLAVVVGAVPVFLRYTKGLAVWQAEDFGRCLAATALLGAVAAVQWKKSIERTEELTWNL